MIDEIDWPPLTEPYATALRAAVAWILDEYAAVGIIACGSIIRGNPGPSSDFDNGEIFLSDGDMSCWRQIA